MDVASLLHTLLCTSSWGEGLYCCCSAFSTVLSFPPIELVLKRRRKNGNWSDSFCRWLLLATFSILFVEINKNVIYTERKKQLTCRKYTRQHTLIKSMWDGIAIVLVYNIKSTKCVKYQDQLQKSKKKYSWDKIKFSNPLTMSLYCFSNKLTITTRILKLYVFL